MMARRWWTLLIVLATAVRFCTTAMAIDPSNVLVLYNNASPDGQQIANYYQQVHPQVHLLGLTGLGTGESITADDYLSILRPQVLSALQPTTQVIVTTKGLPLLIHVTEAAPQPPPNPPVYEDPPGTFHTLLNWQANSSLESELTNIRYVDNYLKMGDQSYSWTGHWSNNPYYKSDASFDPSTFNMLLASRLDGYSVGTVTGAIDRAQNAFIGPSNSPNGPFHFVVDNDPTKTYAPSMAGLVNNVLNPMGMPVTYDNTTGFVGSTPGAVPTAVGPVIGYDSFGKNQASTPNNYTATGALGITLADGAVFNTWESYNAQTFTSGAYTGAQGQVAQWLEMGGTAAMGNVDEPGASIYRVANEDQLFKMLLAGKTFGEAAWSSLRELGFVNTVVGDPLMTWRMLLSGDVNRDGTVDSADLAALGANWGKHVGLGGYGWSQGDLNGDGVVNLADLSLMGSSWGQVSSWANLGSGSAEANALTSAAASTPEPSSIVLLAVGLLMALGFSARARRRAMRSL